MIEHQRYFEFIKFTGEPIEYIFLALLVVDQLVSLTFYLNFYAQLSDKQKIFANIAIALASGAIVSTNYYLLTH
jgi:hypothetical protein